MQLFGNFSPCVGRCLCIALVLSVQAELLLTSGLKIGFKVLVFELNRCLMEG
jgi:hypothetical protein